MIRARGKQPRHRREKYSSGRRSRTLTAVIVLIGVLVMSYPSIASWVDQVNQSKLVDSYKETVDTFAEAARLEILEEAREYNEELKTGVAHDPYTDSSESVDSPQYRRYEGLLEGVPSGVMARLRIPSIDVDLPVYHGTSNAVLKMGVGHLYGTALPLGGDGLHPVLTAHSGLADAVMFTNLEKLEEGDLFQVETYGEKVTYQVVDKNVILPTETDVLQADSDRDLMSLVTCTPVTINTHRLVVTGERVENPVEPSEAMPNQDLPGFPWWAVWTAFTLLACVIYISWGERQNGRKEKT